jgi:hypothetical protein
MTSGSQSVNARYSAGYSEPTSSFTTAKNLRWVRTLSRPPWLSALRHLRRQLQGRSLLETRAGYAPRTGGRGSSCSFRTWPARLGEIQVEAWLARPQRALFAAIRLALSPN